MSADASTAQVLQESVRFPAKVRARHTLTSRLLTDYRAVAAAVGLLLILLAALLAPLIAPHDPADQSLQRSALPPAWVAGGNPSWLFGTDRLGRDILSRTIHGARVSLLVGLTAVTLALVIGGTLGLLSGYYGGWIDDVIMRIADIQLSIPYVLLAIALAAVSGPSLVTVIVVLGVTRWVSYARVGRSDALAVSGRDFVQAARSIGASDTHILLRHILPNTLSSIVVLATAELALVIMAESALAFLGLGIQPPTPTWGGMLAIGRDYLATAWWMSFFPGLALMATVLTVNVLGDWLRDVLDPRIQPPAA